MNVCLASIGGSKRKVPHLLSLFHEMKTNLYSEVIKMRKRVERSPELGLELRVGRFLII